MNDPTHTDTDGQEPGGIGDAIERRKFLEGSWKVLGAALVVEAGWTSYDLLNPKSGGGFGSEVDAGPVEDFMKEGAVKYFLDGRFYVTQHAGGLRALYQKCPHLGCRVPFCESSERFECPCHGSVYNVIGEYVKGPTPRGMDRFPIRIENGRVLVDTSQIVEGPARGILTGPTEAAGPSCVAESTGSSPSPSGASGATGSSGGA
jgi:Ferredoxin subunits of nitrite reductase and ring-hydroxylating dioxygenases